MRRFSFHSNSASPVSPVTPWESSNANSPHSNEPSPQSPSTPIFSRRMFGRKGVYGNKMTAPDPPIQVEEAPITPPMMNKSAALRLSKRAEMLDKRVNVHGKQPSQMQHRLQNRQQAQQQYQNQRMPPLPELEGTIPEVHELEGDRPALPELEGDAPNVPLTAVPARVFAAGAVKAVTVKAKRASLKLFPSFRPERTHYSVDCSSAADEVARAERETKEKKFLAEQVNACRIHGNRALLELDDELCAHAQQHADNLPSRSDCTIPPTSPAYFYQQPLPDLPRPDTVTTVASPLDRRSTVTRIISDRGLGAMACVERWNSGQYRRHAIGIVDPERHQPDCPCRLELVYDAIMHQQFTKIGVGRATEDESGVWIVELAV